MPIAPRVAPLAAAAGALAVPAGLVALALLAAAPPPEAIARAANAEPHHGAMIVSTLIYQGNATCSGSKCHSMETPVDRGYEKIGDESTIWEGYREDGETVFDPHSHAHKTLGSGDSKKIASALGLASATDSRCLSCHAIDVPQQQRGDRFELDQGVSCETCHGPGEKYRDPHAKAGWTSEQRAALGTDGLRTTWGILDTTDLALRAEMCVACHLSIDKDMIDAGHPALDFELGWYNDYLWDGLYRTHWTKPPNSSQTASLWAVGQAVALDAARGQASAWKTKGWDASSADALVAVYEKGVEIARKHFGAGDRAGLAKSSPKDAAIAAAAADLAAAAGVATTREARLVLARGVASLALSRQNLAGDEFPSDDLFDALDAAIDAADKADAAAFAKHVGELAAVAP